MDAQLLSRLLYNVSTLASLTHQPPIMTVTKTDALLKLHRGFMARFGDNAQKESKPSRLSAVYATEDPFPSSPTKQIDLLDLNDLDSQPQTYSNTQQPHFASQSQPHGGQGSTAPQKGIISDDLDFFSTPMTSNNTPTSNVNEISHQYPIQGTSATQAYSHVANPMLMSTIPLNGVNAISQQMAGSTLSNNNPFGQQTKDMSQSNAIIDPFARSMTNNNAPLVSNLSASNPMNDPFSMKPALSNPQTININTTTDLYALGMRSGYSAPKNLWLPAAQGRGLEIIGTCK